MVLLPHQRSPEGASSASENHGGRGSPLLIPGYPYGLAGEAIPLSARIAALAEVYDAVTNKRVYKEALGHEEVMEIILKGSGTQFDPAVVEAFLRRERDFVMLKEELADDPVASVAC